MPAREQAPVPTRIPFDLIIILFYLVKVVDSNRARGYNVNIVSNDTECEAYYLDITIFRIETREEASAYISKMKYALDNGATITFQETRKVDENRDEKYTNGYTVRALFPDENPADALRRELKLLPVEEYLRTVKDLKYPDRSEMREFGKVYHGTDEIYIKIRVEMFDSRLYGNHTVFVMSFHYAVIPFDQEVFPYRK